MSEVCSRTVMACGSGVTSATKWPCGAPSEAKVSMASTSVFSGKCLGVVEGDGAAGGIDLVSALAGGLKRFGDVMGVAQEEAGGVNQDAAILFGLDGKSPQNRLGKGLR